MIYTKSNPPQKIMIDCPSCGSKDYKMKYRSTLKSNDIDFNSLFCCTNDALSSHNEIMKCQNCGLLFNNPQFPEKILQDLYSSVRDPRYHSESPARIQTFSRLLDEMHQWKKPPGKLLDIGCYTGVFLELASKAGWICHGVELSSWAVEIAMKRKIGMIFQGSLEGVPLQPESMDVITFWDVIEHVSDPNYFLQEVNNLLKPNGIIAISTHMVDSWPVRILGRYYPFFMEMHLIHYSRKTITQILNKNGFLTFAIKPHRRILHLSYFLEKAKHFIPFIPSSSSKKNIAIPFTGLFNIYAHKKKGS